MSKNSFNLDHWFLTDEEKKSLSENLKRRAKSPQEILAPFYPEKSNDPKALVQQYFVPGWTGESLISKNVKDFNQLISHLKQDAFDSIKSQRSFPRKRIQQFYNEFLSLSHYLSLSITGMDSAQEFWEQIGNPDSPNAKELDLFCQILSYRIAVIFVLKARFIITLNHQTQKKSQMRDIIYPQSFLGKFFKSASSTELKSKAFEQNIYSWYKPSDTLNAKLEKFSRYCLELSITDIIKNISIGSEAILKASADYSHSLSHKQFGLFLNNLLINFPIWLESLKKKSLRKYKTLNGLEIISCKFYGDNLESLSLSHWLAQDNNKELKWDQILCPDFTSEENFQGNYYNIINEIQFLTFLANIAQKQGQDAKTYISHVANSHLYNRKNSANQQAQLLDLGSEPSELTYDRIIMNLASTPKNNPHHFVFNQIVKKMPEVKNDGLIYVLTSKKLFIPSQQAKVESLLQDLKLEGVFNFEELTGKGEVGSFLYILRKKNPQLPQYNNQKKECCYNFRFTAELNSFHDFRDLTELIQTFYLDNFKDLPPLYQKMVNKTRLEFYQDAIANGQLIHSSSRDTKNITHPHFFKQLMQTCHPLNYFYEIQPVDFQGTEKNEQESLFDFSNSFRKDIPDHCIMVDKRNKDDIKIKMISSQTLEAVSYEYGHALCSYFYIYPKWKNLPNTTIAAFLSSEMGRQIIQLTFSNEIRKTKGNLSKVLVPAFFQSFKRMPPTIKESFSFLTLNAEDLLTIHPSELERTYAQIQVLTQNLVTDYPSEILEIFTNFRQSLTKCLDLIGYSKRNSKVNFSNPLFKTPLLLSKKYNIYPDNQDIYVEFNSADVDELHQPLKHTKKVRYEDGCKLELSHEDGVAISLHSDENMLSFIEFIVQKLEDYPISQIIQSVQAPNIVDLNNIFEAYNAQVKTIDHLLTLVTEDFNQALNTSIFSNR